MLSPPFRADHVGSLLRPPAVLAALQRRASSEIDNAELRGIEDDAIAAMTPKLESTGIKSITDGEYRREWFHLDFLKELDGATVEGIIESSSDSEETVHQAPPKITVSIATRTTDRLSHGPTTADFCLGHTASHRHTNRV